MIDRYQIQRGLLTNIADKIRGHLGQTLVYQIKTEFFEGEQYIDQNGNPFGNLKGRENEGTEDPFVKISWIERFDHEDYLGRQETDELMGPWGTLSYKYLTISEEEEAVLVPVLYDCFVNPDGYFYDSESPRDEVYLEGIDVYIYEGKAKIEEDGINQTYDKWSKHDGSLLIEFEDGDKTVLYTSPTFYVYTNEIIDISEGINPSDYPDKIDEVYQTGYTNGRNDAQGGQIEYINNSVSSFSEYVFSDATYLSKVQASKVSSVGKEAFKDCTGLKEATLPVCSNIFEGAFMGCTSLKSFTFASSYTLGSYALHGTALEQASLSGCISLGEYAFGNCSNLASVSYQGVLSDFIQILKWIGSAPTEDIGRAIQEHFFLECKQLQGIYFATDISSNSSMQLLQWTDSWDY